MAQVEASYGRVGTPIVHAVCIYELAALHIRRLPTLTCLFHRHRHQVPGRLVMVLALGWLAYHLAFEPSIYVVIPRR